MNKTACIVSIVVACLLPGCASVERDWEEAQTKNTIYAYKEFLSENPDSEFSSEARQQVEDLEWKETQKRNTVSAYQKFLKEYPQSPHCDDARNKIGNLQWAYTKRQDTTQALRDFIQKYPDSPHAKEAQERLKILENLEEKIKQAKNPGELEQFLDSFSKDLAPRLIPIIEDNIVSRIKQGTETGYSIPLSTLGSVKTWDGFLNSTSKLSAARATLTSNRIVRETQQDVIPPKYMVEVPRTPVTLPSSGYFSLTLTADIKPKTFFGHDSIIRFAGQTTLQDLSEYLKMSKNPRNPESLVIYGDGDSLHRLTFFVSPDKGLIYVRGKGRILHDGKETTFGY